MTAATRMTQTHVNGMAKALDNERGGSLTLCNLRGSTRLPGHANMQMTLRPHSHEQP
jgi:hypothetical protein